MTAWMSRSRRCSGLVGVERAAAARPVGGVDDGGRPLRRPHRGGPDARPLLAASSSSPSTRRRPQRRRRSRSTSAARRGARCRPSPARAGTSGWRRAARRRAAAPCRRRARRCRRARPGRCRAPRWRRRTRYSAGGGMRTMGASMHGSSASGANVRSAGTTTSSTWKWWLPVPRSPDTCQVSSITTWSGENTAMRSCGHAVDDALDAVAEDPVGVLAAAGEAPPAGDAVAAVDGRRSSRVGLNTPATMTSGPSAKSASNVARGSPARSTHDAAADHHGPADRRVGARRAPRRRRIAAAGRRRRRRGCAAGAAGSTRPRSARRAGRAAAAGPPRSRRPARRSSAPAPCTASSTSAAVVVRSSDGRSSLGPPQGRSIGASAACRARSSSSQPPLQ